MKLNLSDTSTQHLAIDLRREDTGARRFTLKDLRNLAGQLELTPVAIKLRPASVASAQISELHWDLPHGGTVSLGGPATIGDARATIDVARAGRRPLLPGSLQVENLDARSVTVDVPRARTTANLSARGVSYSCDRDGRTSTEVKSLVLSDVQASIGGFVVRAATLELTDVVLTWGGGLDVQIGSLAARGATVLGHGIHVEIGTLALGAGLRQNGGELTVAGATIDSISVTIDSSAPVLRRAKASDTASATREPTSRRSISSAIDPKILDQLSGHLAVDVRVQIVLPIIGHRDATHRFRLPIENGAINYEEFESGLSGLENAFIDIELDGDTLVLERDIPLIPGDSKPIITWPLADAVEVDLARRKRVRLRRLARYEVADTRPRKKTASESMLRGLLVSGIDLALQMSPAQTAASPDAASQQLKGWLQGAALGGLRIQGELRHPAVEPARCTEIEINGHDLRLTVTGLLAGRANLRSLLVNIGVIEQTTIQFNGLRPQHIQATLRDIELQNVALRLS